MFIAGTAVNLILGAIIGSLLVSPHLRYVALLQDAFRMDTLVMGTLTAATTCGQIVSIVAALTESIAPLWIIPTSWGAFALFNGLALFIFELKVRKHVRQVKRHALAAKRKKTRALRRPPRS